MPETIENSQPERLTPSLVIPRLLKEIVNPGWETVGKLVSLSGLQERELQRLPSNNIPTRALTALMRVHQDLLVASKIKHGLKPLEKPRDQGVDLNEKSEYVISPDGSRRPFKKTFDDYVNPFDPESGQGVYGTEYAQLVNIAARKAQKMKKLTSYEVLKLTLLAVLQLPPGLTQGYSKDNQLETIMGSSNLLQGKRYTDEVNLMRNADFFWQVPLTVERIQDRNFVNAIHLKTLLKSQRFKDSVAYTVWQAAKLNLRLAPSSNGISRGSLGDGD